MKIFLALLLLGLSATASAQQDIFPTEKETDIPYRIPAIACTKDGTLIAVADYRHSRMDIGFKGTANGRIDLHRRVSINNGRTWQPIKMLIRGRGNEGNIFHTGFGDPCIAADRKSNNVVVLSCAGDISFPEGNREHHQGIAVMHSTDAGKTWTAPKDISESVYSLFDECKRGPIRAMFIGSGKIHQSRFTKVDKFYRLYCANLVTDCNGKRINYVLYSDDFGHSWQVLGNPDEAPIENADEPKVDELPNGNIIISSRCNGGRHYNIFTFTSQRKGTGHWGKQAFSGAENKGVEAKNNSCNGELMVLPVIRTADNKRMHIALQSLPFGPGRANVGIYYKALDKANTYHTPEQFASNWTGHFQVSTKPSAYSTMTLQGNNTIAFLFEEETHCTSKGGGYTIVYNNYTIEQITNGQFSIDKTKL